MIQRKPFNRRAYDLLIAGAFIFLAVFFAFRTSTPQTETLTIKVIEPTPPRRVHLTTPSFDAAASYSTIIDNNLFRPLGWTPPRPSEPYRLLGTVLAREVSNTPLRAIIQSTAGNKMHIVTTGDKLDADTEVVEIQHKQVTLSTNGTHRTLCLSPAAWLR